MDLKVMPQSNKGHKFMLCIINKVTYYLITVPVYQSKAEEIRDALIKHVITKYCIPDCIIMDQDSTFMSSVYLFNKLDIKINTVASYNHQSLKVRHRIKSLSTILMKHLNNLGQMWQKYLSLATFAYITFNIPSLVNFSLYELVFGKKIRSTTYFRNHTRYQSNRHTQDYHEMLNKRLNISTNFYRILSRKD